MNYFEEEFELIRTKFDINVVIEFTKLHDVQIIRGEDYMYLAYIDEEGFGTSLTPLGAMWFGIQSYNKFKQININDNKY